MKVPFSVIHIPHGSTIIPGEVRGQYLLDSHELEHEILLMTDWYTDELFIMPQELATTVRFPVSRLVVDPERFLDDSKEPMAAKGMGIIYAKTSDGKPLRRPMRPGDRSELINAYYIPHQEQLSRAVREVLSAHGRCLIIDAHSFPSQPFPYESDQQAERPEICIGTDDFHTPSWLVDCTVERFRAHFHSVEINLPFGGSMVPAEYLRKDRRVHSIMVEVNRSLYMDEQTGAKLSNFDQVLAEVQSSVAQLIDVVAHSEDAE
jgi:N-formylglutamate deformylase